MHIPRHRVILLLTLVPLGAGPAFGDDDNDTDEQEQRYPYGKAEFDAQRLANDPDRGVLVLFERAGLYQAACLQRQREGRDFREVEHFGREAKNWYRQVLNYEPSNAYAVLCMGFVDLTLGRASGDPAVKENYFSSAMARFRGALEKRPGYADAHLYMAQVHALRREFADAEKNLRLIIDSGIEDSQIHGWMAYVLAQLKRGQEAAVHVRRAIELDDPSAAAQWSRTNQQALSRAK